jgi:hypothetical protein
VYISTDYDINSEHVQLIRTQYLNLVELFNTEASDLLHQLCSMGVIDYSDLQELETEVILRRRNGKLLWMLEGKSPQQFLDFLKALEKSGQPYIARMLRGEKDDIAQRNGQLMSRLFVTI